MIMMNLWRTGRMDIEEEFEIMLSKLFILLEVIPDDLRYKIELRYNRYKLKEEEKNEKEKPKPIPNYYS